ncbi:MAG: DUF3332 domain-containing protein [Candidatus Cloacimonetes bacterium]|nr:DUF3332 domain-containing protein [Candidatus Cloacimonadota bacterium]
MKKFLVIQLVVLMLLAGCYGNFSLTRKVYQFNGEMGDGVLQTVVFWAFCIIPVYSIASFLDAVVFNTLEFWTGTNPIAMQEGETEIRYVESEKGTYQITASQNRFDIVKIDGENAGETLALVYSPENKTWSMENDDTSSVFAQMHDSSVDLIHPDGFIEKINF